MAMSPEQVQNLIDNLQNTIENNDYNFVESITYWLEENGAGIELTWNSSDIPGAAWYDLSVQNEQGIKDLIEEIMEFYLDPDFQKIIVIKPIIAVIMIHAFYMFYGKRDDYILDESELDSIILEMKNLIGE